MRQHANNDNYGLLFRLGWQAQSGSDKEQHDDGQRQTGRDRTQKQKEEDQRDYVDRRLRELRAWERGLKIRVKDRA